MLGTAAAGTAVATGVDALARPVDGMPAAYFLVALALPLWDRLPARLGERVARIAAIWLAIAAVWYVITLGGGTAWWRGAGAFGVACLVVGWTVILARPAGRGP